MATNPLVEKQQQALAPQKPLTAQEMLTSGVGRSGAPLSDVQRASLQYQADQLSGKVTPQQAQQNRDTTSGPVVDALKATQAINTQPSSQPTTQPQINQSLPDQRTQSLSSSRVIPTAQNPMVEVSPQGANQFNQTSQGNSQNFSISNFMNMSPEQQLQAQSQSFYDQSKKQLEYQNQVFDTQGQIIEKSKNAAQAQLDDQKAQLEANRIKKLEDFKKDQEAQLATATRNIQDTANQRQDTADTSFAFQGFGRSTKAAEVRDRIRQDTQDQIASINRQSSKAVTEYEASLLNETNAQIEKLQSRVDQFASAKDQVELERVKAQGTLMMDMFKADPMNPNNILATAQKLSEINLNNAKATSEEKKALRERATSIFDNSIKYGFIPEALSDEELTNMSQALGVPKSMIPKVIDNAITKANNEKAQDKVQYLTDNDGNVRAAVFDPKTGQFNVQNIGQYGKGTETRYQAVIDPITGQSRVFDPIRGAFLDGGGTGARGFNSPMQPGQPGKVVITANNDNTPSNLKNNCVLFARSVVSDLPLVGLSETSHEVNANGKRKVINSSVPAAGSVAIMPETGFYGHVGVVESVNGDGTVTIVEANNPSGTIRRRTVNPQQAGIEGYYVGNAAKAINYKTPNTGRNEGLNSQNQFDIDPNATQLGFERALANGLQVDDKTAKAEFFTAFPNSTIQDFSQRYTDAQIQGQAKAKPPTEGQVNSATFSTRVEEANRIFDQLASQGYNFADQKYIAERALPSSILGISLGGLGKSDALKQQEQAEKNFITAVLRRESGASIAPTEFDTARQQYFPQPGDSSVLLEQKRRNREIALQGLKLGSGGASLPSQQSTSQSGTNSILSKYGIGGGSTTGATNILSKYGIN